MNVTSSTSAEKSTSAYTGMIDTSIPTANRTAKKVLGQEDFLKLLAVQFQTQDPMKPMEDTAFIAQMAQFTSLEQSSAMNTSITHLRNSQDIVAANSYIGHQLTFDLGKDKTATGIVEGVEITDGVPRLIVGDTTYSMDSVLLVEPAPAPQSASTGS